MFICSENIYNINNLYLWIYLFIHTHPTPRDLTHSFHSFLLSVALSPAQHVAPPYQPPIRAPIIRNSGSFRSVSKRSSRRQDIRAQSELKLYFNYSELISNYYVAFVDALCWCLTVVGADWSSIDLHTSSGKHGHAQIASR